MDENPSIPWARGMKVRRQMRSGRYQYGTLTHHERDSVGRVSWVVVGADLPNLLAEVDVGEQLDISSGVGETASPTDGGWEPDP